MRFTDILSFCFSILGLYGLVCYLRFLIPRNVIPYVSAVLTPMIFLGQLCNVALSSESHNHHFRVESLSRL